MLRKLTAFYLREPGILAREQLETVEYSLGDAFRDFCRETFDTREPLDYRFSCRGSASPAK